VTPDLALGGKATGGSVNLGTVGGRADIMDAVVRPVARLAETGETDDWRERIFASGTFTGNPLATAAGVATMRELTDNSPYGRIDGFATQVRDGLNAIIKDTGLPMHVTGVSSIVNIHFAPGPLRNMRDTARADVKLMEAYENALLAEGIWIIAQQAFISTVHTQEHIDRWLEVSDSVLRRVAPAWT
jgi:glutamate-1-semialdehyde 2,1-aminomutase